MTTHEALQEVETLQFSARLNLASNLRLFYLAASRETAVGVLAASLQHDPDEMSSVLLTRILDLSRVTVDPRYRHPSDAALAVYLWLLGQFSPLGAVAAEVIAQTPQCWWASRVAAPILEQAPTTNQASGEVADTVLAAVQNSNTASFEIVDAVGQGAPDAASLEQPGESSESLALAGLVRARSKVTRLTVLPMAA
jgi:hypothetical protein